LGAALRPFLSRRARRLLAAAVAPAAALAAASAAVAAPSPVGTQTATTTTSAITVGTPAGTIAGDVLVATVTARVGAAVTFTAPSGWTLVRRETCVLPATQMTQALYVHTASASEPASSQWSFSKALYGSAGIAAYRGVDGASPVAASSGSTAVDSPTAAAPSVTTPAPQTLVAGSFGRSGAASTTAPTGTTQRYALAGAATGSSVFALDQLRPTAGATGTVTTTSATTAGCAIAQLVALRPGAGDVTAPTAPASLRSTGATQTSISVAWNASTDNVGVTGYGLSLDGVSKGSTTGTTTTFSGLVCGKSYAIGVDAGDAAGNRSTASTLTATTAACPAPPPPSGGTCTVASTAGCVAGSTLSFKDAQWVCTKPLSSYGKLPLKVVVDFTVGRKYGGNGAVDLTTGCAGDGNAQTVDLIVDVRGDGKTYGPGVDAMKVRTEAGYNGGIQLTGHVDCGPKYTASEHPDGVQVQGGRDITFVDFSVGNYDAGMSTCQGAGGAFFYSNAGGYAPKNVNVVRGKYIACNHSLFVNDGGGTGSVTGGMFRSGRTDGTDAVCTAYAGSPACTGTNDRIAAGVTLSGVTCQRWNAATDTWQ
jgi:chitodextrinase